MSTVTEHSTTISIKQPKKDVHAKMPVFYNPVMVSNRNISILLLNEITKKEMKLCLPLAGSGIRALRFLKELKPTKIKELRVNDKKETFNTTFKNNLKQNNIPQKSTHIHNQEASLFLLQQPGFDYIDIDPFGTPNPFLAAAVARISRDGILAVTATDTAALTGTYGKVTSRKYWAKSLKNHMMHEIGLRILIRKVQLQGVQFDKALTPILAYHKDHYFRIYFQNKKGKQRCDTLLKQHNYLLFNTKTLAFKTSKFNNQTRYNHFAGPLWTGKLFDKSLLKKMCKNNPFPEETKFLTTLLDEKDIVGFYDIHALARKYHVEPKRTEFLLEKLNATRTHFSLTGIKTEKDIKHVIKYLKQ